jgi:hypothetical protein
VQGAALAAAHARGAVQEARAVNRPLVFRSAEDVADARLYTRTPPF